MTELGWHRPRKLWPYLSTIVLCGGTAFPILRLFLHSRLDVVAPLFFLTIPLLAAALWGQGPGLAGSITGCLIFALFLYEPIGSLRIANSTARASLALMVLLAAGFALFLTSDKETLI